MSYRYLGKQKTFRIEAWPVSLAEVLPYVGDADYQLRIPLESLTAFEDFLRHKLTKIEGVGQVMTNFALRPVVYKAKLPLGKL